LRLEISDLGKRGEVEETKPECPAGSLPTTSAGLACGEQSTGIRAEIGTPVMRLLWEQGQSGFASVTKKSAQLTPLVP
jgi:hypothetical protein